MKIAVATNAKFTKVAGHAGRARSWLVFDTETKGEARRIQLAAAEVIHHFDGSAPHPLDGIDALIALSAGEGFMKKMEARGVHAVQTAETDPGGAVDAYLAGTLSPPRPRPIGELLCKAIDRIGGHRQG